MQSEPIASETTSWFRNDTEHSGPSPPPQYALTASYSIEPNCSPVLSVVEAVVDVIEPPGGQTSLRLYEHVNPDALEGLIVASSEKKSDVEVRFTIEEYLIVVRSTKTILIYEPLEARR
ncbi:HalOD1 output domain-containing protein [Haladaptatus halobius]|uniref:HalOD1 output domain-containing protein n=1 Tax=Haladaptatus halobius TaxID=2884875 RepID=UPI001D0A4C1B|nr:HalOD1 output domain-containing protein [Haladaptatus halobius]